MTALCPEMQPFWKMILGRRSLDKSIIFLLLFASLMNYNKKGAIFRLILLKLHQNINFWERSSLQRVCWKVLHPICLPKFWLNDYISEFLLEFVLGRSEYFKTPPRFPFVIKIFVRLYKYEWRTLCKRINRLYFFVCWHVSSVRKLKQNFKQFYAFLKFS